MAFKCLLWVQEMSEETYLQLLWHILTGMVSGLMLMHMITLHLRRGLFWKCYFISDLNSRVNASRMIEVHGQ